MKPDALLTDRLDLRPVAVGELEALHRMRSDPRNCAYLPEGPHENADVTRAWIERLGGRWDTFGIGYWTVRLRATGQVLGIGGVDRRAAFWNLYYLVDADCGLRERDHWQGKPMRFWSDREPAIEPGD